MATLREDIAAALNRINRPKRIGPAVAHHLAYEQKRLRHQPPSLLDEGRKAQLEARHQANPGLFHGFHHRVALGYRHGHGLFHEDVLARLQPPPRRK